MEISYNLYFFCYDDILYLCLSPPCGPGDVKEMSINLLTFHWSPPALSEGRRLSVSIWCSAEVLISSSDQYWPALVLWEFQFDSKCLMSSLRTSPPIISNLSCNVTCNVRSLWEIVAVLFVTLVAVFYVNLVMWQYCLSL